MPKLGINLKQLTREELEEYARSLEILTSKSDNPILHLLLYEHDINMSHKKRCEILRRTPIKDHNKAIINFLWQKIKTQLM